MASSDSIQAKTSSSSFKKRVAIVGARGYSGSEVKRWLLRHPKVELRYLYGREEQAQGAASGCLVRSIQEILDGQVPKDLDLAFLCTPADAAQKLARVFEKHASVIDLSGGHRLPGPDYEKWYGQPRLESYTRRTYGLVPWFSAKKAQEHFVVANPGCFATSALLPLIPLLKEKIVSGEGLYIDTKSGATGAGKKPSETLLFTEVSENFSAYRIGQHQHIPEIRQCLRDVAGFSGTFGFVTHLLPLRRGIFTTIYLRHQYVNLEELRQKVRAAYADAYETYPLVRVCDLEESSERRLSLSTVVGTPECCISFLVEDGHLLIFSLIDNLLKGAATQAIENMNLQYGWPVDTGLSDWEEVFL